MEFKYRAIDERGPSYTQAATPPPHHHSPFPSRSTSYFTEQALRAGILSSANLRHGISQNLSNREEILREIEKGKIREDIILAEIATHKQLQAQVSREMPGREMVLHRGDDFSRLSVPHLLALDSRLPTLPPPYGDRSLEERLTQLSQERFAYQPCRRMGEIDNFYFRQNSEPRITEITPTSDLNEENVIFLAKPGEKMFGAKHKAEMPPSKIGIASRIHPKKKYKVEWSCQLCQVTASSEQCLNQHLQGKKHQAIIAALKDSGPGKDNAAGLSPIKDNSLVKVTRTSNDSALEQVEPEEDTSGDKCEAELLASMVGDASGLSPRKKHKQDWSCVLCQVTATSEQALNQHFQGKKHEARLRNSGSGKKCANDLSQKGDENGPNNVRWNSNNSMLEQATPDVDTLGNLMKPMGKTGDVNQKLKFV